MKRWISGLLACVLCLALGGCAVPKAKVEVALLVNEKGTLLSNGFIRSAWEAVQEYCDGRKIPYAYYEAENTYEEDYIKIADQAVKDGAKLLIAPGFMMESAVFALQDTYPNVKFVTVDGVPNNAQEGDAYQQKTGANTFAILYAEEQSGFLAGYAAVMDGYRSIGFFGGMAVPAVMRFGYGFIQGAEYAAQALGLAEDAVTLRYLYCGSFIASPEIQARATVWYLRDTELIFACGGAIGQAVMKAAEAEGKFVIGVDNDQSADSETVVISAIKMIRAPVYDAIAAFYDNAFPGGQSPRLGANMDGIGLSMATSRLQSFSQAAYDEIYTILATDQDGIASGLFLDDRDIQEIPTHCVDLILDTLR